MHGGLNEVIQINENKFVGIKKLSYKKEDKSISINNVYFVFERLTERNINFWERYVYNQKNETRRMGVYTESKKTITIIDGTSSFDRSLRLFKDGCDKRGQYSIWIAYVTRTDPRPPNFTIINNSDQINWSNEEIEDYKEKYKNYIKETNIYSLRSFREDDIEMSFSVFANETSPITTHMGIFRNYKYFRSEMKPHINLSMELHGFAAIASKIIYPQIEYMVTKPVDSMVKIMREKLENTGQIWIGTPRNKKKSLMYIQNFYPSNKSSPLNNEDNTTWQITNTIDNQIRFLRPGWFTREYGHDDLLNSILTSVISINALSEIWQRDILEIDS